MEQLFFLFRWLEMNEKTKEERSVNSRKQTHRDMMLTHIFPSPEPRQLFAEPPDSIHSKTDGMCVHACSHPTRKAIAGQETSRGRVGNGIHGTWSKRGNYLWEREHGEQSRATERGLMRTKCNGTQIWRHHSNPFPCRPTLKENINCFPLWKGFTYTPYYLKSSQEAQLNHSAIKPLQPRLPTTNSEVHSTWPLWAQNCPRAGALSTSLWGTFCLFSKLLVPQAPQVTYIRLEFCSGHSPDQDEEAF